MAALTLVTAGRASANDEPITATDRSETTIVLHVVNYAALSQDVLDKAMARVSVIYGAIGVRTVWVASERPVRKHQDGGLHLTVMLLSRDMAQKKASTEGITEDVLGQALPTYGRAFIFVDRIAAASSGFFPLRLGGVIAHEVGHLVLGMNSHSPRGLMRAKMDMRDFHAPSFDNRQRQTIHAALKEKTGQW